MELGMQSNLRQYRINKADYSHEYGTLKIEKCVPHCIPKKFIIGAYIWLCLLNCVWIKKQSRLQH